MKGIWVPIEIWEDDDLCLNEKALLMDIDSFTSRGRECYISNDWICEHLGVAKRTAQMYLKHLIDRDLVRVVKFDGRVRYLESNLPSLQGRGAENCMADVQNFAPQTCRDLHHTYSKGDLNKKTDKKEIYKERKPSFDFRKALIDAGVSEDTADAWLAVRKAKRSVNTEIAWSSTLNEIRKTGYTAEYCIRTAVAQSWGGFRADWLDRLLNGNGSASPARPRKVDNITFMLEQRERRLAEKARQQQGPSYDINDLPDEQ